MASVRSLGDGRWQVRVYLEVDGKPVRPSRIVHARNRSQAEAKANSWLQELRASGRQEFQPKTVADAADAWYQACVDRNLTAGTLQNFAYHRDAIKQAIGHLKVEKLTTRDVERYYAQVRSTGIGVKHRHRALRAILYEAMHLQWVGVNVARNTRRPAERAKRGEPPTLGEIVRLLKVAYERGQECGNALVIAVGTGMRRGEIAAMRASRVDWDGRTFRVDTAVSNIWDEDGELVVKAPKSNQVRVVPLSDRVAEAVMSQAQVLEFRARAAGVGLVGDPWLWSERADGGKPRPPEWFTRQFAACRVAAGVGGRLHDLRHAFATLSLDSGVPLPTVSEILGHSNTHVTASIYSHGVTVTARKAVDRLGSMLAGELEA